MRVRKSYGRDSKLKILKCNLQKTHDFFMVQESNRFFFLKRLFLSPGPLIRQVLTNNITKKSHESLGMTCYKWPYAYR